MIRFIDKTTGKEKKAFSITNRGDYYYIKYNESGLEYTYLKENIKIIQNNSTKKKQENSVNTNKLKVSNKKIAKPHNLKNCIKQIHNSNSSIYSKSDKKIPYAFYLTENEHIILVKEAFKKGYINESEFLRYIIKNISKL